MQSGPVLAIVRTFSSYALQILAMLDALKSLESHREQIIARLPSYCQARIQDRFGRYQNECLECRRLLRNLASDQALTPERSAERLCEVIIKCDCLGGAHLRRQAARQ